MAKDNYYFQHDYGARNDPKLMRVLHKLGVQGIGCYWCIIEQMYEQGGSLPRSSIETIAFSLHVEESMLISLIDDFLLFETDEVDFWSNSVQDRLEKRMEIAQKRKEAIRKRWQKYKEDTNVLQENNKSNTSDLQNDTKERKEKERKEKEIELDESNSIDKENNKRRRFTPPTLEEVKSYCQERNNSIDPVLFYEHYTENGWTRGKNKMKDWKATIRTWERKELQNNGARQRIEAQSTTISNKTFNEF